ncbi:MAG TPA: hypothetical protein VJC12_00890 [Candidatus Paceibacterota bacterium]
MTMPAWQRREMERQHLLEEMRTEMYHADELVGRGLDSRNSFLFGLAKIILRHLDLKGRPPDRDPTASSNYSYWRALIFFEQVIWSKIFCFGRSQEEKLALLAQFLKDTVIPAITFPFRSELSRQEMLDPKRILLADRMDEITIPE